eukprot:TRINITY_DN43358_c0_g1_i1.p1 TRINITY_DN43358_c0_g1~~TRINITY_DN43358_c0_g1_i1.p1  ORF type:complete len:204 (+),score=21.81 TRINITY_DN43358_c0_g1_i1:73-684(+)
MPGEHMEPGATIWRERVNKERTSFNKALFKSMGAKELGLSAAMDGAYTNATDYDPPPLHGLHRTMSTPNIGGSGSRGATPALPQITGQSGRGSTGLSRSALQNMCDDCGGVRPASRGSLRSSCPSLRSASAAGRRLGSDRGSMRSCATGLSGITSASLRREVQEAVQMEVAKVIQPLKEKLINEQQTRQRLEQMLLAAGGKVD